MIESMAAKRIISTSSKSKKDMAKVVAKGVNKNGQSGVDWRSLYLYAVCLITLLIILFSTISILNGAINLAFPDPAYIDPYTNKENLPNPALLAQQQENEQLRTLKRILTSFITIAITAPIYLYHWRQAKKN
jgi:hypothetical protein